VAEGAAAPGPLPTLTDGAVTLRPLAEGEADALTEIALAPGVAEWWGWVVTRDDTREGIVDEGRAFAIEAGGELAGWLGFEECLEAGYRHAAVDLFVAPGVQSRGVGRTALRLAARWLIEERGHHRLTIDPEAANERAIRSYAAVGFRPVGVMRQYCRRPEGHWVDSLLMDLLADELQ
jgi:aminoglycoside 6'-N-acetyltransferase